MVRHLVLAFIGVSLASCQTPLKDVEMEKGRPAQHADPSPEDGPTLEQQMPLKFEGDRTGLLSYPTFPAGEARFKRDETGTSAATVQPIRCDDDEQCTKPDRCLRPAGSPGFGGVCGQAFGADGQDDKTVRYVKSCKEAWECPDQFQCVRVNGPWGLCVKVK